MEKIAGAGLGLGLGNMLKHISAGMCLVDFILVISLLYIYSGIYHCACFRIVFMKTFPAYLLLCLSFLTSCQTQQRGNTDSDKFDAGKTIRLRLNPATGSGYYYDIVNETDIDVEVDNKKVDSHNKTEAGVTYSINVDSAGNYLFSSVYDKLHISSQKGDIKTELDATNGSISPNPVERMLGMLKDATINVTITPMGNVIDMSGYKEIGEKLISGFSKYDIAGRKAAREEWETNIGNGLIKKNFDQLFKIFPDSAVHLGDTWKLIYREQGDLSYNVTGQYKLKAINAEIAVIESTGKISTSENSTNALKLEGSPSANLTGNQSAEFEIETKTGMVINCRIKTALEGTIVTLGREVPVKAKMTVKVSGKKIK